MTETLASVFFCTPSPSFYLLLLHLSFLLRNTIVNKYVFISNSGCGISTNFESGINELSTNERCQVS